MASSVNNAIVGVEVEEGADEVGDAAGGAGDVAEDVAGRAEAGRADGAHGVMVEAADELSNADC